MAIFVIVSTISSSAKVVFTKQRNIKAHLNATGKCLGNSATEPKGTVYKINCSCDASYIGETKRPLEVRIKEHKTSVEKCDMKSAISEHLSKNPNHKICWNSIEKICSNVENTSLRKMHEAIQIRRIKPKLNRDQGLFLPYAYDRIIQSDN